MKRLPFVAAAAAVLGLTPAARAQNPQAECRLTWDENYIYAAFQVDDLQILASHREPMAKGIELDDGVGLSVQVGDGPVRTMLVSAAGGFTFLENGQPKPLFSIKYGVSLQGTLNRDDDRDRGYMVELAIPWNALGADGKSVASAKVLAQASVRKRGVEAPTVFPAALAPIALTGAAPDGALAAPRAEKAPLIDGEVNLGEWPMMTFRFAVPAGSPSTNPSTVVAVGPDPIGTTAPALNLSAARERRLFARFLINYQADPNKVAFPLRDVLSQQGTFLPVDQPVGGLGPWYSADRVGWVRSELAQLRRSGIDVALTQLGPADSPLAALDEKALLVAVAGLREMQTERQPLPQLGLYLDTAQLSNKLDLSDPAGQELLYRSVARWFELVPPELRAVVRVGGVPVYPVFLSDTAALTGAGEGAWAEALRQRFFTELGVRTGVSIAFVAPGLAGAFPASFVSPGSQFPFVPRRNGQSYQEAWEVARKSGSPWIVIDSWNDFTRATEIAPSRQYGERFVDMTRLLAMTPDPGKPATLQFGALELPRRWTTGAIVTTTVPLTNVGGKILTLDDAVAIGYRWVQNGQTVAEGPIRIKLRESLPPGFTTTVNLGIATIKDATTPLPPGDYELRLEALLPGAREGIGIPVRVESDPGNVVEFSRSSLTPLLRSNGTFTATVRLRWLGKEALPPGEAQLVYQILSRDGKEVIASGSTPVDQALPPGVFKSLPAQVRLRGLDGLPLEPAFPERRLESNDERKAGYRLRWALTRAGSTQPIAGTYEEAIAVYPGEDDARILPGRTFQLQEQVRAQQVLPIKVTLVNRGLTRWEKGRMAVTVRWFHADGFRAPQTQAILNVTLDRPVAPGEATDVSLDVQAPERAGRYLLGVFVLRLPDQFLAAQPISRPSDLLVFPVDVTGGRLEPLDLTALYNTDAVATEGQPTDGNLDGTGATLPAEWFPHDTFGVNRDAVLYPSGYFADVASEPARNVSFRYGGVGAGQKNALACSGQSIPVPRGKYIALHLAVTATGGAELPLDLTLVYKDGEKQKVTRTVREWTTPPTGEDAIAFLAPRRQTPSGPVGALAIVRHLVLPVQAGRELASIQLPTDTKLKIFAITLER